ncbi:MAG: fumarate hydratase C-terminal domain-containing protein [Candidatus Schekmanbacteria bacterium]|nr:fumarate hydratase C-terminal domain-containing protein [Candidatus Schekmanbacteria bacterium]
MLDLQLPISTDQIRDLKVGDFLNLTGTFITARDSAHQYLYQEDPPEFREILQRAFIFHCGPIAKKQGDQWEWAAAGPTTSMRMEPYAPALIERYQLQGIVGKGGMGAGTQEACSKYGVVYCQAPGGCAALLTQKVVKVKGVYKLEDFGIPEAIWVLEVKDFPVLVTMDSHGGNWYRQVKDKSLRERERLQAQLL